MPEGFIPNPHFPEELEAEPEHTSGLAAEAKRAKGLAYSFAPFRTGAYRDSIEVIVDGRKVYLSAKDFKAWWIEHGTVDTPVFAPLRRGVVAAGLKFTGVSRK